jgi:hypothetical protein
VFFFSFLGGHEKLKVGPKQTVVWTVLSLSLVDAVAMAALSTPTRFQGFWPLGGMKEKKGKMVHVRTH